MNQWITLDCSGKGAWIGGKRTVCIDYEQWWLKFLLPHGSPISPETHKFSCFAKVDWEVSRPPPPIFKLRILDQEFHFPRNMNSMNSPSGSPRWITVDSIPNLGVFMQCSERVCMGVGLWDYVMGPSLSKCGITAKNSPRSDVWPGIYRKPLEYYNIYYI